MKIFPEFFLIFAVLRSGESLRCEVCQGEDRMCSGNYETCEPRFQTCAVVVVENTYSGRPKLMTVKTCEKSDVCKMPLQALNMGRGRYERSSVICCEGNTCQTAAPRFQPGFIKPNGKYCPACFATSAPLCGSAQVDCSGNEAYCLYTYQKIQIGNTRVEYIKRGCATKALCEKKAGSYTKYTRFGNPHPLCIDALSFR